LNVLFVANDLQTRLTLLLRAEFTMDRNHTNVLSVTRHSLTLDVCRDTGESTREKLYQCLLCDKSFSQFSTLSDLQRHICNLHSNGRCHDSSLEKLFKNSILLKHHIYTYSAANCTHVQL